MPFVGYICEVSRSAIAVAVVACLRARAIASLYWDADGSAVGNNISTGANLGGSGTWDASPRWYNGVVETGWTAGGDGVFSGTAGTVTLAATQSVNSLSFK